MKNTYFLTTRPENFEFSLESGLADNICHFDHHKDDHRGYPSPSNNPKIPAVSGKKVAISHLDADTFIGILRLEGAEMPSINLNVVEQIDLNGSSIIADKFDRSLLYMLGIGKLSRILNFPRVEKDTDIDVTEYISKIAEKDAEEIIKIGEETQKKSFADFDKAKEYKKNNVALFSVDASMDFNPSMAYDEGVDIVVVYRKHYASISIYVNPSYDFVARGTWAGIEFAGHPKACGSPRGVEFTFEDAINVFKAIAE